IGTCPGVVTVGGKTVTRKLRSTGTAAANPLPPGCEARPTTAPAPVAVRVEPDDVAGPLTTENGTARPELELALSAIVSPRRAWPGPANAIVWLAGVTTAGAGAIVSTSVTDGLVPLSLVAVSSTLNVPACVGVPAIAPV